MSIELLLTPIIVLYLFWFWAIASLNLYRGWLTGKLTWKMPVFYLVLPALIGFVLFDCLMNYTFFAFLCMDLPAKRFELVTQRMSRYKESTINYYKQMSSFVCGTLNLFNFNSEDHC